MMQFRLAIGKSPQMILWTLLALFTLSLFGFAPRPLFKKEATPCQVLAPI